MTLSHALESLKCSACGGVELNVVAAQATAGAIACSACGHRYPIVDGIVLTRPALWGLDDRVSDVQAVAPTFSSYSNWWQKVNKGIGYRQDIAALFEQHTGVDAAALAGKRILDAGCGGGRFLSYVARAPGTHVVAFDLGRGLLLAKERNKALDNVLYVQGDILNPPFRDGCFDFLYSFGVVHHTPDPCGAFLALSRMVAVGGLMAIYLYYRRHLTFRDMGARFALAQGLHFLYHEPVRSLVARMPHAVILRFAQAIAYRGPLLDRLRAGAITRPLARVAAAVLPASIYKPFESREHNVVRNYDHYSTRFNFSHSPEEVLTWYQEAGFDNVVVRRLPVTLIGQKQDRPVDPMTVKYYRQSPEAWDQLEATGVGRDAADRWS